MIVEFVGLPGVGKTFLCHALKAFYADARQARVQVVVEKEPSALGIPGAVLEKLCRAARFTAMHPGTFGALVLAIHPKARLLHGGRLSKLINLLAETDRSARVPSSAICICEQGVMQAVWSLEMRSDDSLKAELLEILSPWLPERIVYVQADRAAYESRLRGRKGGRSHFDHLQVGGLNGAIERGMRSLREIIDLWVRHVPAGACLNFWNGQNARVVDIVEWVGGAHAAGPSAALRVQDDREG